MHIVGTLFHLQFAAVLTDSVTAHIAVEAFTCCILFKNVFSFGMTYRGYDWLVINGTKRIFIIVASAQVAVCVLTIPLCMSSTCFRGSPMMVRMIKDHQANARFDCRLVGQAQSLVFREARCS